MSVLCDAAGKLVAATPEWLSVAGTTLNGLRGQDLTRLQGPATDTLALGQLMESVRCGQTWRGTLIHYSLDCRAPFRHTVSVTPLASPDGRVRLFRASSADIVWLGARRLDTVAIRGSAVTGADRADPCASAALETSAALADLGGCSFARSLQSYLDGLETLSTDAEVNVDSAPKDAPAWPLQGVVEISPAPAIAFGNPTEWACGTPPPFKRHVDGEMRVLCAASAPHAIVWASASWLSQCGFGATEIIGMTLKAIQGPGTDMCVVARLMEAVRGGEDAADGFELINYDKNRSPFSHRVSLRRVRTCNGARFYCAISRDVCRLAAGPRDVASPADGGAEEVWGQELEDYFDGWARLGKRVSVA